MAKKILAMFLAALVCCTVFMLGASANDGTDPVSYSIDKNGNANPAIVSIKGSDGSKVKDCTVLKPGDTLSFISTSSAKTNVTIYYYPDADVLFGGKDNLAKSTVGFKSFQEKGSYKKNAPYNATLLALGEAGPEGAWSGYDSVGTDLGYAPVDFALKEDEQDVAFLGWVVNAVDGKKVELYGLWDKKNVVEPSETSTEAPTEKPTEDPTAPEAESTTLDVADRLNVYVGDVATTLKAVFTLLQPILESLFANIKTILYTWLGYFDILA